MLSTLLNSLATFFSKFFLVASFLPVLAFGFFNAVMAFLLFEKFHDWVGDEIFLHSSTTRSLFITTSLTIGLLAAAYVLSALTNYLRGILEGKWPDGIRKWFVAGQVKRLQIMQGRLAAANRVRQELSIHSSDWIARLKNARAIGEQANDNNFSANDPAVRQMRAMRGAQRKNQLVNPEDLSNAVNSLERALQENRASLRGTKSQRLLGDTQQELVIMIQFTAEHASNEHIRLHNELTSHFGLQQIAPTTMGNIANTIQTYAIRRYNCNLDLFWSELQRIVQKDDKAYAALQESKAQLDFLISCVWLTLVWSAIWVIVLGVWAYSVAWFWSIALLGPALTYFWYRAATEHYRSFADVLTTSLDLFRLDLLTALHISAPADVEDERNMWDKLHRLTAYGENMNFRYRQAKPNP
jgi:hypothetical protein